MLVLEVEEARTFRSLLPVVEVCVVVGGLATFAFNDSSRALINSMSSLLSITIGLLGVPALPNWELLLWVVLFG